MITAHNGKGTLRFGKLTMLYVLYPSSVYTDRDLVLAFASHRAGMTSNALPIINNKTVIADILSFYNRTKI
jgi:hypothetical protein